MAWELWLGSLLASAGWLRVVGFCSYSFWWALAPWDPQYLLLSLPLGTLLYACWRCDHQALERVCRWNRCSLAWMMLVYGLGKVLCQQFTPPSFLAQDVRLYQASGAWKAWAFFGHDPSYQQFLGWGEVVGAILLWFRPTVLLGASLLTAMLVNICWVNFTHDIGVRVSSCLYLAQALFLLAQQRGRLLPFLLGRAVPALPSGGERPGRWGLGGWLYGATLLSYLLWAQHLRAWVVRQPPWPLAGVWQALGPAPVLRLRLENPQQGSLALATGEDPLEVVLDYHPESQRLSWKIAGGGSFAGRICLLPSGQLQLSADSGQSWCYRRVLPPSP